MKALICGCIWIKKFRWRCVRFKEKNCQRVHCITFYNAIGMSLEDPNGRESTTDSARSAVPRQSDMDVFADKIAAILKGRGHTVAVCEATSGGLITASLQGVSGASEFYNGTLLLYTRAAYRNLPKELRRKIIANYRDPEFGSEEYRHSKLTFVLEMANYARDFFGATYGLAESGATESSSLGSRLQPAGAFTAVGIAGPSGCRAVLYDSPTKEKRRENMRRYGSHALETFLASLRDTARL